jgi:DNA-binding NtrC family response regulator
VSTVLLVDDETDLVAVLQEALQASHPNIKVETAGSFDEALGVLGRLADGPDVVVADHRIGGRTGLELLSVVARRFPAARGMLFTGQASPEAESQARALGAKVVWKPVELATWLREVEALLAG